jgi:hypothetical protein
MDFRLHYTTSCLDNISNNSNLVNNALCGPREKKKENIPFSDLTPNNLSGLVRLKIDILFPFISRGQFYWHEAIEVMFKYDAQVCCKTGQSGN